MTPPPALDCGCGCTISPNGTSLAGVGGATFKISIAPSYLSYIGTVADHCMFQARMCHDYALYKLGLGCVSDYLDLYVKARNLARYALKGLSYLAGLIAHECGHVYLGGGHCSHNCCFEAAAEAFRCGLMGKLGLPLKNWSPRSSGDYPHPAQVAADPARHLYLEDFDHACGGGSNPGTMWSLCHFEGDGPGHSGQAMTYCNTRCISRDPTLDCVEL